MKKIFNRFSRYNRSSRFEKGIAEVDPGTDGHYANGDVDCQAMHKRIDPCICGIQAWRFPGTCTGCRWNKEKGEHHETT